MNCSPSADGPFGTMEELSFNVDHGYLEGLVRGMKAGILTQTDYHNLAQCDTLEGENMFGSRTKQRPAERLTSQGLCLQSI